MVLDTSGTLPTLHFLACCNGTEMEERHGQCDELQCNAYQNEPDNYQIQHRDRDYSCNELVVHQENVTEILETGSLPLLRRDEQETVSELSVGIVASQPTPVYLALSQVWADGLGNPVVSRFLRGSYSSSDCTLSRRDEVWE